GELTRSVPLPIKRQSLRVRNRDPSREGTTALLEVKAIPQVEPLEWGGSEVHLRISTLRHRAHLTARLRCGGYIDYGGRSSGDYGGVSRALDYVFQRVGIDGSRNRVVNCRVNCSHIVQEFAGLDGNRVRDINDVLISHLERGREEIAPGIAEIDIVDHRDDW